MSCLPALNHRVSHPLIIGHYGGGNTGDEAMLTGLLGAVDPGLRRRAAIVVKRPRSEILHSDYGADTIPAAFHPVLRALLKSDGLMLGGGTHFHDDYTTRRYLRHLRYMLRITSLSMLAKLLGREVMWLGMGFGPFYRHPTRWVTRLGLKFCDRVTVRDAESHREISRWISPEKLSLAFDLAALLVKDPLRGDTPTSGSGGFYPTLGICVTSVRQCLTCGPRVEAVFWRRLAAVVIRALDDRPKMRVRVVVFRGGNYEDDWTLSRELHDTLARAHPGRLELVPYSPEPRHMLSKVAECDAFLATRYHSGVLAYLAGCSLLFFDYHRKVRDLAREIGLSDAACITPSEDLHEQVLEEKVNGLLEGNDAYRARLPVSDAMRRACLNVQTLTGSC